MKKTTLFALSFICLFGFRVFGQEEATEPGCADCHSDLVGQAVMHYPAEDACDNCHMSNGNEHPQEGVLGFDLGDEMPALCFMCHEEPSKTTIHAPAEMGECLMCHSPHGSPNKGLLLKATESVLCAECHDMEMTERQVKHGPLLEGKCSACHEPHQSDIPYLLKSEKPGLCFQCHTQARLEAGYENQHYPFEDDCSNCHETHSSEVDGLLSQKSPDLCFNCHDTQETLEASKVVHKVVTEGKACANCHSPHASKESMLLLKAGKNLCLDCHDKPVETEERTLSNIGEALKEGNLVHGAIDMDGCTVCHLPHASDQPKLLNAVFPERAYAAATVENFDLCFLCHDAELMTSDSTDYATNFRNGNQNLHFLHINGPKGRSCNLCHDMHGSANEHLIADKVRFGNWDMPVEFTSTENGGSCLTGCHAELNYSR